jgi:nucleotide-binding universal stress UspA family protein
MTRALVCIDGFHVSSFLDSARATLASDVSLLLVHVVDTRPEEELSRIIAGLPGRGPGRHHAEERVRHTTEIQELRVREEIDRWLASRGVSADVAWHHGRPEREIVALAQERHVELIVLGRGRGRAGHHPGPGPFPLSPVARFVTDHASADVLLLWRYLASAD